MSKGFPSNIIYRMVEDNRGNLWLTTNNGLVCFNPETDDKRVYTTANGLLSNQFNYQSGYKDKMGRIYLGSINGFITFDPSTFVENYFCSNQLSLQISSYSINECRSAVRILH